jgi:hypothetical protein
MTIRDRHIVASLLYSALGSATFFNENKVSTKTLSRQNGRFLLVNIVIHSMSSFYRARQGSLIVYCEAYMVMAKGKSTSL